MGDGGRIGRLGAAVAVVVVVAAAAVGLVRRDGDDEDKGCHRSSPLLEQRCAASLSS